MFRVLTVAREFGSGGGAIAQKVAEHLKWNLLDKALIDAIARAAQVDTETARECDERVDSWVHRVSRRGLWHGAFEGVAAVTDAEFFDAETAAAIAREVVSDAGARGNCVIVGRGAQCALQERPDVLHVFVYAPWRERVERVRTRVKSARGAEELIRATGSGAGALHPDVFWVRLERSAPLSDDAQFATGRRRCRADDRRYDRARLTGIWDCPPVGQPRGSGSARSLPILSPHRTRSLCRMVRERDRHLVQGRKPRLLPGPGTFPLPSTWVLTGWFGGSVPVAVRSARRRKRTSTLACNWDSVDSPCCSTPSPFRFRPSCCSKSSPSSPR